MDRIVKSRRGTTAVELMIALGVLTILGLISAQVVKDVMKDMQQQQLTSTRDQVALWVRQSAGNIRGLQNSVKQAGNTAFYNCVCGNGGTCPSAQTQGFTLYDISNSPVTPIPLFYNAAGVPCDQNASNCFIRVTVNFAAQCLPSLPSANPVPPASCNTGAEFIAVFYKIDQNPLATPPGNQTALKTVQGSVFTPVSSLYAGVCP